MGISLEAVRNLIEQSVGQGGSSPSGHIPFTPRAKKVLEMSLREALQMGHNYIGTEHILLGLIREGEGVGAHVLVNLGADLSRTRQQVIQLISGYEPPALPLEPSDVEMNVEPLSDRDLVENRPVSVDKNVEDSEPPAKSWYLVDYANSAGGSRTATILADGWDAYDDFVRIGGHAFRSDRVASILKVAGPPADNTVELVATPKPAPRKNQAVEVAPKVPTLTHPERVGQVAAIRAALKTANINAEFYRRAALTEDERREEDDDDDYGWDTPWQ